MRELSLKLIPSAGFGTAVVWWSSRVEGRLYHSKVAGSSHACLNVIPLLMSSMKGHVRKSNT